MFNLMIVDDDETLLEGMVTAVDWNKLGFQVIFAAKDGVEALEALEKMPCDVLMTDIRMGRMDGLELVKQVSEKFTDMSFVMMSAYDDFSYAQQAMRLGVEDYLLKPINLNQLDETMRRLHARLAKSRDEREKVERIQDRMKGFGQMDDQDYLRATSPQYASLVDHIVKLTLMGNWKDASAYADRLEKKLTGTGEGAFLAMLSSVNLLVSRAELEESLNDDQLSSLHNMQEQIIIADSCPAGMAILRKTLESLAREIGLSANDIPALMERAAAYVDAHYARSDLRLGEVAAYVGLSTNYFSSLFTRHMGTSFSEYLIARRMRQAQLLMSSTEKKTYEIARMVGYENPAYFSAAFRKYTGFSVSDYRRNIRSAPSDGSEKI
ncbi:MAG: response regulator [Lachnospiraceae bacterium]|nr:response regulator [Lachnospiraceae bacterium]